MPEGDYHNFMKKDFRKNIITKNSIKKNEVEYPIGNRIADLYFELKNGFKIVIECQVSPLTVKECKERTKDYNNENCYVLWIIPDNNLGVEDLYKTSKLERYLHKLYMGRVYMCNFFHNDSIFPVAFNSISYITENEYTGETWEKWYKTYKEYKIGEIPNFGLLCIENKWEQLKIARFYDKKMNFETKTEKR